MLKLKLQRSPLEIIQGREVVLFRRETRKKIRTVNQDQYRALLHRILGLLSKERQRSMSGVLLRALRAISMQMVSDLPTKH